jgi:hypothetical protein
MLVGASAVGTCNAQEGERIFANSERAVFTVETPSKVGTGFVVPGDILVTCYHVVKGAGGRIRLRESPRIRATYLAHNENADVALFRLDSALPSSLRISTVTPKVGAAVYVIGTPLGALTRSITNGITSQVRTIKGVEFLQITAPVSPGSSGSPVFDSNGLVVGMVSGSMEEGQANNFAVSSSAITNFLSSGAVTRTRNVVVAQPPPKHLKLVGQVMKCQFLRSSALYRQPSFNTEPEMYVRAKRISQGQRTEHADWLGFQMASGVLLYAPSRDVRLYSTKEKNGNSFKDPYDVPAPQGFEQLIKDINGAGKHPETPLSARSKLLGYGPGVVKHVLARFEFSWDYNADQALLTLADLGPAAKAAFLPFLKDGSETQKEAIARLWDYMAETLDDAQRTMRENKGEGPVAEVYRDIAKDNIKNYSWLRDLAMRKEYASLLASRRARSHAVKLVAHLRLDEYKHDVEATMRSRDYHEAASGFEAFCLIADEYDALELKRQFDRIVRIAPLKTDAGENLNASGLIIHLAYSRNDACFKVLLDLLDNEDEWIREKACSNLRMWPRDETILRMSPLIKDPSQWVRTQALITLAELAPSRFIDAAITLSRSEDFFDRSMAALALGSTKLDKAAPYLESLCTDINGSVRSAARVALGVLGTPSAVTILIRLLDSADPETRKEAREALRKLGKEPDLFSSAAVRGAVTAE